MERKKFDSLMDFFNNYDKKNDLNLDRIAETDIDYSESDENDNQFKIPEIGENHYNFNENLSYTDENILDRNERINHEINSLEEKLNKFKLFLNNKSFLSKSQLNLNQYQNNDFDPMQSTQNLFDIDHFDKHSSCMKCSCKLNHNEGILIRECLHTICRECIKIDQNDVKCPLCNFQQNHIVENEIFLMDDEFKFIQSMETLNENNHRKQSEKLLTKSSSPQQEEPFKFYMSDNDMDYYKIETVQPTTNSSENKNENNKSTPSKTIKTIYEMTKSFFSKLTTKKPESKNSESTIQKNDSFNIPKNDLSADVDLGECVIRCKKVGCDGSGFFETNEKLKLTMFVCPICQEYNCLICKAIHKGLTCAEYQNKISKTNINAEEETNNDDSSIDNIIESIFWELESDMESMESMETMEIPNNKINEKNVESNSLFVEEKIAMITCEICDNNFPRDKMFNMIICDHIICMDCAKKYFTERIKDRNIVDCVCLFCGLPKLTDDIKTVEYNYFLLLETQLKIILDRDIFEIFQCKVRDRGLMKDPLFKWCIKCESGFFMVKGQIAITCPQCLIITCGLCRKVWEEQHFGISCEQFAEWKNNNNPDLQEQEIIKYLEQNGIQCPKCKMKYALAKGGCMHFECVQCKHEFCSGCNKQMMHKKNCTENVCNIGVSGLHAHHPRNCLYYLKEKSIEQIQTLLHSHNVEYLKDNKTSDKNCKVPIQRDTPTGLIDTTCDKEIASNQNDLCSLHYNEYLVDLINKSKIDPISIMSQIDCESELNRNGIKLPNGNLDIYKELIIKEIPLKIIK